MRNFTDKEILDRVEQLPTFTGWKKGEYDIWVRSAADAFDQFDDKAFTYHCAADGERPTFFMSRSGTTNAGSYGLKHFEDYNHEGCAVLKSNVIIYGSHKSGLHHGKAAYRQAKSWPYFRDDNRNNTAEEIGRERSGIIGANVHRAGVNSTVIKNWSTACLVTANLAKFQAFLAYMKSQGNPPLTVAILKEWKAGDPPLNAGAAPAQTSAAEALPTEDAQPSTEDDAGKPQLVDEPASTEQPPPSTEPESSSIKQTVLESYESAGKKIEKLSETVDTFTSRKDSLKALWSTILHFVFQPLWAAFAFLEGMPWYMWVGVGAAITLTYVLYHHRQLVLGKIRDLATWGLGPKGNSVT